MRPTVLIVDDHEEFRTSARALLEAEGFAVVGEAADGSEAIEAVAALRPAIVLLDVQLPGPDGLAVAEVIAAGPDPPPVVLISSRDAAAYGPRLGQTRRAGSLRRASSPARHSPACSTEGSCAARRPPGRAGGHRAGYRV